MRMAMVGVAMVMAAPAMAQEVEPDGPDIVVTAGKPLKLDAKVLRAGQRRFAGDRSELAPNGALRFELWRGSSRIPAATIPITLRNDAGQAMPVAVDGDGRIAFGELPKGRWFLTAPAQSQGMSLRPIVLSTGTTPTDRRLGDLRLQCRVMLSMAKAQASLLAMPLMGLLDAIGGCESKRVHMYHRAEQPLASATALAPAGAQALEISKRGNAYLAPLNDPAMGNDVRVKIAYR
ncbi:MULTISPECIES: hypothetical protein [unclassified Sphingomonas]|uniref:hypothetical protein n=1 Tax=unclassified Sphingomonas TaxID=196159 RepID=UPI0006F81CFA|nr:MULTISPECIES: hypothetical protein [unclassified Sphingomonas]KQM27779.1 hypothetical protein ASE58_05370 [Sphingomonas sp. Leaf9]KQM44119.1 hypothetical protein ASE57_05365 [Sphingomonas sp. Leaf11]